MNGFCPTAQNTGVVRAHVYLAEGLREYIRVKVKVITLISWRCGGGQRGRAGAGNNDARQTCVSAADYGPHVVNNAFLLLLR